jgi:hypothetical protein
MGITTGTAPARDGAGDVRTVRLGLLSAPELPAQVAGELAEELPELLEREHDGRWHVALAKEPLLAGRNGVEELIDVGAEARRDERWDAAICLTDVPLRAGARPLVAAVSRRDKVGVVDIPALGATLIKPRVREAAVTLVADIAEEALEGRHALVRRRPTEALTPIRREIAPDERPEVRYVTPAALGHLRLLSGMVRANRPWRAFTDLSSAVVAAFGTGAYALLSTSIWQLSGRLGWPRLIAIMLCAVAAMVFWLIIGHGLWERATNGRPSKDAALYNAATTLTLTLAVLSGYAALFVLLFLVANLLIESGVFRQNAGHAAGVGAYLALAWLGAAIGTVAGALGSRLESIERVRSATYGHDQGRRGATGGSGDGR